MILFVWNSRTGKTHLWLKQWKSYFWKGESTMKVGGRNFWDNKRAPYLNRSCMNIFTLYKCNV